MRVDVRDVRRGIYDTNPTTGKIERLLGRRFQIYLNGERVNACVRADEDAGEVVILDEDAHDGPLSSPKVAHFQRDNNNPYGFRTRTLHGKVEIKYNWDDNPTVDKTVPTDTQGIVDFHRVLYNARKRLNTVIVECSEVLPPNIIKELDDIVGDIQTVLHRQHAVAT